MGRFLKAEGLTRLYERHSEVPDSIQAVSQAAPEEGELDARGHEDILWALPFTWEEWRGVRL